MEWPICELEGFYGEVQYGFRKNRSTADCDFLILTAIRTAKRKNRTFSGAFCDIAKTYDSICQELIYTKLCNIGFGGRVVSLFWSINYNDCVRISIAHGLTDLLYFTRGVKQGCSLSPMLFALYIYGLGEALHFFELGFRMGSSIISALFFADDLVVISCVLTFKLGGGWFCVSTKRLWSGGPLVICTLFWGFPGRALIEQGWLESYGKHVQSQQSCIAQRPVSSNRVPCMSLIVFRTWWGGLYEDPLVYLQNIGMDKCWLSAYVI